jgi:hypothetical protein
VTGNGSPPARIDAYLDKAREIIDRHGWMVQYVFPTGDGDLEAPFAYTVGLTVRDHPELLITGLPDQVAHELLNDLARRVHHGNQRLRDGQILNDVIQGYPARLRLGCPVDAIQPGTVRAVYGPLAGAVLLQLLWPDNRGVFPDQPGWDTTRMPQPLLEVPL